jgi:hypothetical protein
MRKRAIDLMNNRYFEEAQVFIKELIESNLAAAEEEAFLGLGSEEEE